MERKTDADLEGQLLLPSPCSQRFTKDDYIGEGKRQLQLAGPLVGVNILQFCLEMISLMFVGHLGELPLSGASMATAFASVTGFSVLVSIQFFIHTKIEFMCVLVTLKLLNSISFHM